MTATGRPIAPSRLTVLYDATCPLCVRCRAWMLGQPSFVPVDFVPAGSDEAVRRFGALPWAGRELVVVGDEGSVWIGAPAFLVCLWALERHRELAELLSEPLLLPLASRFFHALSAERRAIGAFLGPPRCDAACSLPHHGPTEAPYR